jgi:hypothetical protein
VNVAGEHILANAGFSGNEDFGVAGGGAARELEQFTHRRTGDNQRTRVLIAQRRCSRGFHVPVPLCGAAGDGSAT